MYRQSSLEILVTAFFLLQSTRLLTVMNAESTPKKGTKFYAVAIGRAHGIFDTWEAAKPYVTGFSGAKFKSFSTYADADAFIRLHAGDPSSVAGEVNAAVKAATAPVDHERKRDRDPSPLVDTQSQSLAVPAGWTLIHFDGGSSDNGSANTHSGAGALIICDGRTVWEKYEYAPGLTNNQAEYRALQMALEAARELGKKKLVCRGDSKLVVEQMSGRWKVKATNMMRSYAECKRAEIAGQFEAVKYEHVYREHNQRADALADSAIARKKNGETFDGVFKDI